ncbi:MAG: sensor histidine kinase, partial [Bacteroidota bacterium]
MDTKVLRFGLSLLFCCYLFVSTYATNPVIDSLENLIIDHPKDTSLVQTYKELVRAYMYLDNQKASEYAQLQLSLSKELNYLNGLAPAYINVGLTLLHQGKKAESLEHLLTALKLNEELRIEENIAACLINIGIVYASSQEYRKAIEFFEEFNVIDQKLGRNMYNAYFNIGACYVHLEEYEKALTYYQKAYQLAIEGGKERELAIILTNIGVAYLNREKYEEALAVGREALEKNEPFQSKTANMHAYLVIGRAYFNTNRFPEAIENLSQAETYALEIDERDVLLAIHDYQAKSYAGAGQYEEAYEFKEQFTVLRDSLDKIGQEERLEKLKSEFEIELLQKDQQIKETELRETRVLTGISIIVLLLVLGLSWVLNRNKLKEQAQKLTIAKQEEELSKQKLFSLQKEQKIKSIESHLKGQTEERKRIAKDLHDSLGSDLASLKLNLQSLDASSKPAQLNELVEAVDKTANEVRAISHHLLPPAFGEQSFVAILQRMIRGFKLNHDSQIELDVSDDARLNSLSPDKQVEVFRIIQEAIYNALKHANPSHISLMLSVFEQELSVLIEDNGKGFCSESISDGIGLRNMKDRAEQLSG